MYDHQEFRPQKVAFCTTCMNRLSHIQQTLPKNLIDHADDENYVFVLLDYGDSQGLAQWIEQHHLVDIDEGRLVYYRFSGPKSFHVSHAKNMAHRCAMLEGADILANIDADNYTGIRLASFLASGFSLNNNVFMRADDYLMRKTRGIGGRIVMRIQDFLFLGGYDEVFDTWGIEDKDLAERLKRMGLTQLDITGEFLDKINHTDEERIANFNGKLTMAQVQQFSDNRYRALDGRDHILRVNWEGGVCHAGCGWVHRNFSSEPMEVGPVTASQSGPGDGHIEDRTVFS